MTLRKDDYKIIWYEAGGFFFILLLVWANEFIDVPFHVFGSPPTPSNWVECLIETVGVLLLAALVVFLTLRTITRLSYLEGFLPLCAFCKKVRICKNEWIPVEEFISASIPVTISHGYCPECMEKHYPEYIPAAK